ncbi:MAG: hypothetical protein J0I48_19025 [Devosia sp.]|uniref:sialate O-acetylesterase n=1 Tax=Devosia sp. 66-22 TaxID=1895753 RepID=UPI0009292F0A|nr:sialate O-acetylesterase [Devosia sp. 66-22]MBN9348259.1 hypothetical protein [Devosia sp.]OJX49000.1 MAG: hypothetical protein BGO81_10420 [Devosia sp. 66-22]
MLTGLAIGQSNMLYRGTGGPWTINPLVTLWNNKNDISSSVNDLGTAWITPTRGVNPLTAGTPLRNNAFAQALSLIATARNEQVRGVLSGRGGEGLGTWYSGGAPQKNLIRAKAVLAAAGVSWVDFVVMALGESDNSEAISTGRDRANAIFRNLKDSSIIAGHTQVIICEASDTHVRTNEIMAATYATAPERVYLPTRLQPTSDGTHFTGDAAPVIGNMIASAVLRGL